MSPNRGTPPEKPPPDKTPHRRGFPDNTHSHQAMGNLRRGLGHNLNRQQRERDRAKTQRNHRRNTDHRPCLGDQAIIHLRKPIVRQLSAVELQEFRCWRY